jgi:hypothetical protein
MVGCTLSEDGTNGTCSYPGLRERTGTSEISRDIEEEKARVFTNVSMLSRRLSVSILALHQPIVYLANVVY